jgi:hypothetical protein
MGILPAFYSRVSSLRYAEDVIEAYHDRSECQIGQKILQDHYQVPGKGGLRHCAECRKYESV